MIAVDTNLLVYAHRQDSPWHTPAARCLAGLAEAAAAWAIPWPCIHEFIGIATHPRIHKLPTPLEAALDQVDAWMASPTLTMLGESSSHWTTLRPMLSSTRTSGPRVHDARIAALCIQHGVRELWTADRDFLAFRGIKAVNPLVAA